MKLIDNDAYFKTYSVILLNPVIVIVTGRAKNVIQYKELNIIFYIE